MKKLAERKMLGVNKSTLWYQEKRLREGKSINIHNKVIGED